ncbi:hypothetical protein SUGI_0104230 [Cryptomeria japonica]|uniref:receptor-like kinase TMK3 n=1 Tax=Cryptomeria japonica TaxID=3369 RepID=UPI002408BDD1|nr:receptor-like kinase TMK3 [Cryptomeria japonica]GLJ09230.1 hypothetical protein SUGI_0104230 [Cryptomeria japonica]
MGLHCQDYPQILLVSICIIVAFISKCNADTDPGDVAVLEAFLTNIDNKELLPSWKGNDACGVWKGVICDGKTVKGISLQGMGLSGTLPSNFNQLGSLTTISLQKNNLYGSLPSLRGLSKLQVAYLNDNQFDGIPSDFFMNLTNLVGIYLNNNPLNKTTGWTLPDDLLGSPQLTNLSLYNTSLVGSIPSFLGKLGSLQVLSLPYNSLEGPLPSSLNSTSLQVLIANSQQGQSQLGGTLDVLGSISTLTQVWLHSNNFSGEIPDGLSKASGLRELLLNSNQLTGTVPQSVASLQSLANFSVDNNLFDGPIPKVGDGVQFTYGGNYFCSSKPGENCSAEVSVLLAFLRGVGYPAAIVKSWSGNDPCNRWAGVSCIGDNQVSVVNLAKRNLIGYIDPAIGNLSALTTLKLNDNGLIGTIPTSLAGLKALKVVDVSNNNLNGPVPTLSGVQVITEGNVNINNVAPSYPPGSNSSSGSSDSPPGSGAAPNGKSSGGKKSNSAVIIGIVVGCVVFIVLFLIVFAYKRKKPKFVRLPTELQAPRHVTINGAGSGEAGSSLVGSHGNMVYPLWVLKKATDDFNPTNLLGKGGFGSVYEGKLEDGSKVAVKRMDPELVSGKGLQEFQAEISMLGKVRHKNLVALLGYCTESNERLLVYEYMHQGTLSEHLFYWEEKGLKPLDWNARLYIALDVAHGMQYLHNLAYKIIIHRDLKPSNILLDDNVRAKVSDFGLAKLAPEDKASLETRLAGTFGYLAPEYAATGRVNTKSDVYSFGVVLMELITGQKVLDEKRSEDKIHLVPWFRHVSREQEQFRTAIDPILLATDENIKSISAVAELAWHSTQREPNARPDMGHAVAVLGSLVKQWKPSTVETDDDDIFPSGMTPEQARWKIFDDLSLSMAADRSDVGTSQGTFHEGPGSVSAR